MIQATLQIKTSSHRALRKKTLALIKDSSGKPILLCSLTPRSKKRNEGAKSRTFKESGTKWGTNEIMGRKPPASLKKEIFLNESGARQCHQCNHLPRGWKRVGRKPPASLKKALFLSAPNTMGGRSRGSGSKKCHQ